MDPGLAPMDDRYAGAPAGRWLEAAAALAAWLSLVWLTRQPPCAEGACAGVAGGPFASMALVLGAAWIAPGWMAWRMTGLRGFSAVSSAAFACGLGLAWLALLAAAALAAGLQLDHFVLALSAGGGLLTAAFLVWCARARRPQAVLDAERGRLWGLWPALAAALALLALLAVAGSSSGFTYGSDEWFYLRVVRQYLDGRGWIYDFDVWEFVVALLVRLAGVGLLEGYRVVLPPFLIAAAALAFAALAEAVLRDGRAAAFAFVLQAVYCLSDMHTRGTGAGMALLARVVEDKYAALLIAVPLVQAAVLRLAAGGPARVLMAAAAVGLGGGLVHPLAAVWVAVSVGVLAMVWLVRGRRLRWQWALAAAAAASAVMASAFWLRSIRPAAYYDLTAPANARLLGTIRRQLIVLSLERGRYMGDPRLLEHPLVVAALLAALWLAWRARGSSERTFLVGAMALPVVLVFVPPAAVWAGSWISPWILPRLLWAMPVTLTLAAVLQDRLAALQHRLGAVRRPGRAGLTPSNVAWTAAVAIVALLLAPRITRSVSALHQRNRIHVSAGERELVEYLASEPRLSGNLLAPPGLSVRLPAWTSRVRPLPGPDMLRGAGLPDDLAADCARLLEGGSFGDDRIALLDKHGIAYLAARNGSPLGRKLARLQPAFAPLFKGTVYTLYEFRKERWPPAAAARPAAGR